MWVWECIWGRDRVFKGGLDSTPGYVGLGGVSDMGMHALEHRKVMALPNYECIRYTEAVVSVYGCDWRYDQIIGGGPSRLSNTKW